VISNTTKDLILETSRIEEVVGEFVALKKRGSNLLGLCPFHNERTPSFTVSPAKGFFKCFGCGKAGDSVTSIMEHEHLTFPEALRYLAGKYNITIEEEAQTAENIEAQGQRESLFVVSAYAQRFFTEQLLKTEEGKAIGLSYFRERGFTDEIINRFQLGYSPDRWDGLTKSAIEEGYQLEYLEKTGLTIVNESKQYDRFRGRVMFPIHNLTGRVIAFGARILKADPKSPKYLNSPESEIYHKSKSLYGIAFAKKSIINQDACFLVEGYTDVISMHQAGLENVVASSGTSLTVDQIRLIGRYTRNITVLYDGDTAGIKASLRGIDLILEEGMNVRVVLFPDGEDPDSFARSVSTEELKSYLQKQAVDFISFKTKLLLQDTANDPIKKAGLVRDIVETIAKVPDAISRAAYLRQTSVLMEMSEAVLLQELNKILRKNISKHSADSSFAPPPDMPPMDPDEALLLGMLPTESEEQVANEFDTYSLEEEIIRILLHYADETFSFPFFVPEKEGEEVPVHRVKDFIINELSDDGIRFSNEVYAGLLAEFSAQVEHNATYDSQLFIQQLEPQIKSTAITLVTPPYVLSNWENKGITVKSEREQLYKAVLDPVIYLKKKQVLKMKRENQESIRDREKAGLPFDDLLEIEMRLFKLQEVMNRYTSTVVQK
jgi:DNA primase